MVKADMRLLICCIIFASACTIEKQPAGTAFSDDFNRSELGANWKNTGANYRIDKGELVIDHAYNHPLWLTQPIPQNGSIDFDVWSNSSDGDIKIELWGDGHSFAETTSYTATSYVFIFGGWHNQLAAIARMNEHGDDRKTRADWRVEKGRRYHFHISRKDGQISWDIDGKHCLSMDDRHPLRGSDHAYLGINDWETELHFDNLKITPATS